MATTLHTFLDIFDTEVEHEGETTELKKIIIPIIQRDYAQGRKSPEVNRVRDRFLTSLKDALENDPITLDFIYGDIDSEGVMTPLDGQQRLTTLFLLHWYAAKKEGAPKEEYDFLKRFSYETRYSARDFCSHLIDFEPSFEIPLSEEIVDQPWFPLSWLKDPTISSMLVVLDAIDEKLSEMANIWSRLKANRITFFFLPIKDMGLTDELYIKMNSRGKPLTQFEHFKAELERSLREIDKDAARRIAKKIDTEWTDMLWKYRDDENVIDDAFVRYFRFVCDVICYRNGNTPRGKSTDIFDLITRYFSIESEQVMDNVAIFESFYDCWITLPGKSSPQEFFSRFMSRTHEKGKILVEEKWNLDIFEDCLRNNGDMVGGRNRKFPLNRMVMLYAIVVFLLTNGQVTDDEFSRRLRIVNNLVRNSDNEIADSETRQGGNRMPAILRQVDSIINNGVIDESIPINFNAIQLAEEIQKLEWTASHPEEIEILFKLEDHELLDGQIGIIGLDNLDLGERFESLFRCSYDAIDCALMATGDYSQQEKGARYRVGSSKLPSAWKKLFHKSSDAAQFEKTSNVLKKLLTQMSDFSDDYLTNLANDFVKNREQEKKYDWRYYYIKYKEFRPGKYGTYRWGESQYDVSVLWAEKQLSENAYQPFLKEASPANISRDSLGQRLLLSDCTISCAHDSYHVHSLDDDTVIESIPVAQEDGIDCEDRIVLLQDYLAKKESKKTSQEGA